MERCRHPESLVVARTRRRGGPSDWIGANLTALSPPHEASRFPDADHETHQTCAARLKRGLHKSAGACARRGAPTRARAATHASCSRPTHARALAHQPGLCGPADLPRAAAPSSQQLPRREWSRALLRLTFLSLLIGGGAVFRATECSPCVAVWHKASRSAGRRCGCLRWITTRWPVRRAVRSLVQLHASKPPACMLSLTRVAHWTCATRPRRVQQRPGHRRRDCPAQPARARRCDHHRESWRPRLRRLHFRLRLGQSTAAAVCRVCLNLVWTLITLC